MLLLTLPGTLTIYYGEEIGMTNAIIPPEYVQDPAEKKQPGIGMGRDPERSPMQWDASEMAGFTDGRPWLPLGDDRRTANVEVEGTDNASILNLYRKLIALRRVHPALVEGELRSAGTSGNLLSYERIANDGRFLIVLNFGNSPIRAATKSGTLIASTDVYRRTARINNFIELRASEGSDHCDRIRAHRNPA